MTQSERDFNSGILTGTCPGAELPPKELWEKKKNGLVIIECPQRIPCNPCHTSCPTAAVKAFSDINDVPDIEYEKCTGCAMCVAKCPGLACFVVDLTWKAGYALMKLPYEMLPRPKKGDKVACLDRKGETVCESVLENVTEPWKDSTLVVHVGVPADKMSEVRAVKVVK